MKAIATEERMRRAEMKQSAVTSNTFLETVAEEKICAVKSGITNGVIVGGDGVGVGNSGCKSERPSRLTLRSFLIDWRGAATP